MNEPEPHWNLETAENAYLVISRYVEHTQISGIIIAMLAGAVSNSLGEEKLDFLVQSEHWKNYMASRRDLEASQADIEALSAMIERLRQQTRNAKPETRN